MCVCVGGCTYIYIYICVCVHVHVYIYIHVPYHHILLYWHIKHLLHKVERDKWRVKELLWIQSVLITAEVLRQMRVVLHHLNNQFGSLNEAIKSILLEYLTGWITDLSLEHDLQGLQGHQSLLNA